MIGTFITPMTEEVFTAQKSKGAPNSGGVYGIWCGSSVYVGTAYNLVGRWRKHRKQLREDDHHNKGLQRLYRQNTEDAFFFSVLEFFDNSALTTYLEEYWIVSLNGIYNLTNGCSVKNKLSPHTAQMLALPSPAPESDR